MSIIKSVSLDEKTAKYAEDLPNFSHFVRECLYRHAVNINSEFCHDRKWRGSDRCNPMVNPVCFVCWPNGSPTKEAIKEATGEKNQIHEHGIQLMDESARKKNQHLFDLRGISMHKPKTREKVAKIALWERFKRLLP